MAALCADTNFGRYLDINEIEKVVRADRLSLTVYGINEVQMPPDFQAARSSLSVKEQIWFAH